MHTMYEEEKNHKPKMLQTTALCLCAQRFHNLHIIVHLWWISIKEKDKNQYSPYVYVLCN